MGGAVEGSRHFVPGMEVALPGRGTTHMRMLEGAPSAPVVLLLPGWTATAGVNWFRVMEPLHDAGFTVIAMDQRGHGRGVRSGERYSFELCADDIVALLDELGIRKAVVAGYSMGGPIALTLYRTHPDRVAGLVPAATAASFPNMAPLRTPLALLDRAIGLVPAKLRRSVVPCASRGAFHGRVLDEIGRDDPRALAQAGRELVDFDAHPWLSRVGVPTAVVLTTADPLVPPRYQRALADGIPRATVFPVRSLWGHLAAGFSTEFSDALVAACEDVARRAGTPARPSPTPPAPPQSPGLAS